MNEQLSVTLSNNLVADYRTLDEPDMREMLDDIRQAARAEGHAEGVRKAAGIAADPGCMTNGQSNLDHWCKKCSASILALLADDKEAE